MLTSPDSWSSAKTWREFFDILGDAVIVLDNRARVVFANTAALRLLPFEVGMPLDQMRHVLGAPAVRWLTRAALGQPEATPPPPMQLADGRAASFVWRRIDARHSAVRLQVRRGHGAGLGAGPGGVDREPGAARGHRADLGAALSRQPAGQRLPLPRRQPGLPRRDRVRPEQVVGHDPLEFVPEDERPARISARERRLAAERGRRRGCPDRRPLRRCRRPRALVPQGAPRAGRRRRAGRSTSP